MAQRRSQPVRFPDYTVFFSYADEDTEDAKHPPVPAVDSALRIFFDVANLEGGESFETTFRENIAICDELIVLATPKSLARDWVMIEVGAAWNPSASEWRRFSGKGSARPTCRTRCAASRPYPGSPISSRCATACAAARGWRLGERRPALDRDARRASPPARRSRRPRSASC